MIHHHDLYFNTHDIDWFFLSGNRLFHIASAGGILPEEIKSFDLEESYLYVVSRNLNISEDLVTECLDGILTGNTNVEVEVNKDYLNTSFTDNSDEEKKNYLRSFVEMALRGCYSFDRTKVEDPEDNLYHLVAWPHNDKKADAIFPEANDYVKEFDINIDIAELKNNAEINLIEKLKAQKSVVRN